MMRRGPRVTTEPGRLIVLSGPSGVGKDTVLHQLRTLEPGLRYSVSYTTRAPRPGEVDGVAYSFIDRDQFLAMAERGEFLEWAEVHGHLYGTSEARVKEALDRGEDIVLKIDVQGAAWIRPRVDGAIFIFLLPPSEEELRRRLVGRDTEDEASRELRFRNAVAELADGAAYDHRVVNDDVGRAAREILDIVRSRRARGTS
jgi:guanylate kinase